MDGCMEDVLYISFKGAFFTAYFQVRTCLLFVFSGHGYLLVDNGVVDPRFHE